MVVDQVIQIFPSGGNPPPPPPTQYTVTLIQSTGGTIASTDSSFPLYNSGATATINASALSGYTFDHWMVDNMRPIPSWDVNNPLIFVINDNHTVQAVFSALPVPGPQFPTFLVLAIIGLGAVGYLATRKKS